MNTTSHAVADNLFPGAPTRALAHAIAQRLLSAKGADARP